MAHWVALIQGLYLLNRSKHKEDAAIYGAGNVPLHIHNLIEKEEEVIAELEENLRELNEK